MPSLRLFESVEDVVLVNCVFDIERGDHVVFGLAEKKMNPTPTPADFDVEDALANQSVRVACLASFGIS